MPNLLFYFKNLRKYQNMCLNKNVLKSYKSKLKIVSCLTPNGFYTLASSRKSFVRALSLICGQIKKFLLLQ